MPSATSDPCRFCRQTFPGIGANREAAERDAQATMMNHQVNCPNNPANKL